MPAVVLSARLPERFRMLICFKTTLVMLDQITKSFANLTSIKGPQNYFQLGGSASGGCGLPILSGRADDAAAVDECVVAVTSKLHKSA